MLLLDIDRFKVINDSLGHIIGDKVLVAVGKQLDRSLRAGDVIARTDGTGQAVTFARLGGDEFAVLIENVQSSTVAARIALRILASFEAPFTVDNHEIFLTTSIGVAVTTPDYQRPEEVLRDADIALYRAKHQGKGNYAVFDCTMNARATERLHLETELRHAVKRGEFRVFYQPIVQLATGKVVGLEALVRWFNADRGMVSPADFIPVAEETGLILPIGQWVLMEACRQVQDWHEQAADGMPYQINVNLSARQFQQANLIDQVSTVLQETGLPARCLKLEITETVVMEDIEVTGTKLAALKDLGVQVAIDDFGTGYSSLNYLKRFPVNILKLDRAFVAGIVEDAGDAAIAQAIVTLAHTLGLEVTAEGIETNEVLVRLRELGCEYGQGYLFARPLPADAVEAYMRNHRLPPIDKPAHTGS
ncbi:MAG: hypothetical protein NVS4B8_13140 [Herpetosiphon sp.]